jgi:hypothetical protein
MSANDELLAVMQRSRDGLERALAPYRDNLDADLGDGWTAREAIAHIALWERVSARNITGEPLPYGNELVPQPWDLDVFNDAFRNLMRGWTDQQILDEFATSYLALIQIVKNAPEDDCLPKGRVWRTIDIDGAGHYHVHFPVVDEMAKRWPEDVEREL